MGDPARAARCAFWLAFGLLNAGELARGGGWVDRAQRLLAAIRASWIASSGAICATASALRAVFEGDPAGAARDFSRGGRVSVSASVIRS